ncbi:2-deoxy-D-gluconate 3-dehydrogenase [Spirochaetia bacterium]|nr:2-deoxy-D-gluconate 3-dehydrogenase [Spirochaetia bacterium]
MKLKDRVVLITDAASPLGVEIASRLGEEGAILVLNAYPEQGFNPSGYGLLTHADPESKASIDGAVQAILDKYGRIDVVVHNNNEVIPSTLEDCTDDVYDRAININVKSAFLYVQAVGPAMKAAKSGNFVFVSSIHDEKPLGGAFTYSIAKGALKMLAKEMVLDMGPCNIRTNIVNMGPVKGDEKRFYSDLSPLYERTAERIVNHQFGSLSDVANAVLLFAGNDCVSANGSELKLDGGFLLTYFLPTKGNKPTEEQQ